MIPLLALLAAADPYASMLDRVAWTEPLTLVADGRAAPDCPADDAIWAPLTRALGDGPLCEGCIRPAGGQAVAHPSGPEGSGRYWVLAAATRVGDTVRYLCVEAMTMGFRQIHELPATESILPLPWLAQLDDDPALEWIVWITLMMPDGGGTNLESVLYPVVYEQRGEQLVADPRGGRALIGDLAKVYASADVKELKRYAKSLRALSRRIDARKSPRRRTSPKRALESP